MKIAGYGSGIIERHGSGDPDPHQNVMDPSHWVVDPEFFPDPKFPSRMLILFCCFCYF
jgi:hypothetical protein